MEGIRKINTRQIASLIAEEKGFNSSDVEKIFDSQFLFTSKHIRKGRLEDIKLDFFGKFRKIIFIKKRNGIS